MTEIEAPGRLSARMDLDFRRCMREVEHHLDRHMGAKLVGFQLTFGLSGVVGLNLTVEWPDHSTVRFGTLPAHGMERSLNNIFAAIHQQIDALTHPHQEMANQVRGGLPPGSTGELARLLPVLADHNMALIGYELRVGEWTGGNDLVVHLSGDGCHRITFAAQPRLYLSQEDSETLGVADLVDLVITRISEWSRSTSSALPK